ncbi:leukosialin [Octodon degus]|uniref:Leukosialin n=1 Tax=Octodon degus TaxID=10160 RepID=A0A6P6F028_OCTDE|nr:leukosialin [Octodon degus]
MALLLLFCGSLWAPLVSPQTPSPVTPLRNSVSSDLSPVTSQGPGMRTFSERIRSNQSLSSALSDASLGMSVSVSPGPTVSGLMSSEEDSTKKPSVLPEVTTGTSDSAVPTAVSSEGDPTVTDGTVTFNSLVTFGGTSEPPIASATNSLETSSGDSGLLVTTSTSSLETSSGDSGLLVTKTTSSLETSSGDSGLLVTNSTSSLETSKGDSGPHITKAKSSVDTSTTANGTFVNMTTSFLETPRGAGGSPKAMTVSSLVTSRAASSPSVSSTEASMGTTPKLSTEADMRPSGELGKKQKSMLLVPMLVALLVVTVIVALLVLWRQRQKRRTGVLTLSSGGKHNGVVDAWAGPAHVYDEEAVTEALAGAKGNKGSGVPETDGSAQRPTLTTFFSRRRSQQGLAMEELKARPDPGLQGEEEPLVGSEDEGPAVGDGAAPQSL